MCLCILHIHRYICVMYVYRVLITPEMVIFPLSYFETGFHTIQPRLAWNMLHNARLALNFTTVLLPLPPRGRDSRLLDTTHLFRDANGGGGGLADSGC